MRGYDEVMLLSQAEIRAIPLADDRGADRRGGLPDRGDRARSAGWKAWRFLQMVQRKVAWMNKQPTGSSNWPKDDVVTKAAVAVSILSLFLAGICLASPPTTKPTGSDQMSNWFKDLANRDPSVRQTHKALMGISRDDLKPLRTIVEKSRPLAPSQAAALHDIVEQVFLAGDRYPEFPNHPGFLGVRFETPMAMVLEANGDQENSGVVVASCIPGFPQTASFNPAT